jgi:hypothetical protein
MVMAASQIESERERPAQRIDALLLSAATAAKSLCISPKTLWTLTNDGQINPVRIGRRVLYSPRELELFIDSRRGRNTLNTKESN